MSGLPHGRRYAAIQLALADAETSLIISGTGVNLWAWWGDPIQGGDYLTTPLLTTNDFLRASTTPEVWIFAAITTAAGVAFSSSLNARGWARDGEQYEQDLRKLRQAAAEADAAADAAAAKLAP